MPTSLTCTVTYGTGEDAHTYSNAYRSCTFQWYTDAGGTDIPSYMPYSAFTGAGYYSSTSWTDDYGFTDYFRLNCFATQWALGFGQNNNGIWQSPGQIYNWSLGGSPAVNFCHPFALNVGRPQSGVYFNGHITVVE